MQRFHQQVRAAVGVGMRQPVVAAVRNGNAHAALEGYQLPCVLSAVHRKHHDGVRAGAAVGAVFPFVGADQQNVDDAAVDVNPALRRRDAAAVFHHVDAAQIHAVKGEHCISGVRSALAAAALSRRRAGQQVHFSADISGSRRAGQKYNQHDPRRYR